VTVNRFECVLSAVLHEDPEVVPQTISFTIEMAKAKLMPLLEKRSADVQEVESPSRRSGRTEVARRLRKALREAELLDIFIIGAGGGGFRTVKTTSCGGRWRTVEWETGAVWRMGTVRNVWAREYLKYPVESEEDLDRLELPDPDDAERYEGVEEAIKYITERGFFPSCSINGFFSGVWYFIRGPLHKILRDIYIKRDFFAELIRRVGEFNLRAEKNLLERGAMMIGWVDDLGYNKGPFMNPKLYEELILPWHKKAIDLAHKYGAFVNMHSHGNINAIVPLLVEAGLDILNPIGPSDNMNLAAIKEKYGDKLCLQGGLSKHIGFMSAEELKNHLIDVISKGSPGGGFILSSEGSLPYEMKPENFMLFVDLSRKYRRNPARLPKPRAKTT
jgi:uroporphyrinogen decarboxylase